MSNDKIRAAAEQALAALDRLPADLGRGSLNGFVAQAAYALRTALAEQPPPEPSDLAHELWALAQCAPGEGIEDAVARIDARLTQPEARPVAWRYRLGDDEAWTATVHDPAKWIRNITGGTRIEFEPLYAAAPPPSAPEPDAFDMERDAVDVLVENGWTWDGDQWQRPSAPEPSEAEVEAAVEACDAYSYARVNGRLDLMEQMRVALRAAAAARATNGEQR